MRTTPSKPLCAGLHLIIITCQITEHTLLMNSSWRPVVSFQKSNKDEKLILSMVPGYLIQRYFTMTLTDPAYVYFPMTCITGISFFL